MRSATVAASALAFAASAMAQVEGFAAMSAPTKGEDIAAGSTYSIEWEAGKYTGPVVISLLGGKTPETLVPGAQLAADVPITNNKFSWSVDCSLGTDDTYGIKIASASDESLFQYSFPFHIDNSGCGSEGGDTGSYPTSVISVSHTASHSGYPTAPPVYSTSCESSSIVVPTSSVVIPPVVNTTAPVYPTTAAPPVETTPIVSTPVEVPVSSSLITYVTSAPPATTESASATSAPTPSIVPVAGAGRNAAGSLAALIAIGAAAIAL
ncbi:hypothetical protein MGN70_005212 [Eutypa lata]|uniref:Putative gpi anchored serine-threonine rich protein n=1 Tax=Eutypa lata (strain UCR-EL1) TaxID=1287681 RepID=M7T517_EUTLA|nr:putative gpi anchored serine-threonine rich protein [Eutypa lata UCREL1]KAI1253004.1 hypothetical protein MGN70_005212 [Eutypa lata]